jgi:small-conductance mechanosensitive channel
MVGRMDALDRMYYGNSVGDYLIAGGLALVVLIAIRLATLLLRRRMKAIAARTATSVDDLVIDVLGSTRGPLSAVLAFWIGSQTLVVPLRAATVFRQIAIIALWIQLGIWASAAIAGIAERMRARKVAAGDTASVGVIAMMGVLGRVLAWAIIILLILDNFGLDITALVAGLGIGGLAIALAVQNILGDLFASVSIIVDRPFTVGDFIAVDQLMGTVEHIGLKTTRVKALTGEQLILPNGDLLKSRIRNLKRMVERRVGLVIGVTYDTTPDQLEALPAVFRGAIEVEPQVRFDRAHFKVFADSSLQFEIVYWVTTADHSVYMDIQQRINLRIVRALAERDIAFAFPTRTVHTRAA